MRCEKVCVEERGGRLLVVVVEEEGGKGALLLLRCWRCEDRMQSSARGAAESLSAVLKVPLRSTPFR